MKVAPMPFVIALLGSLLFTLAAGPARAAEEPLELEEEVADDVADREDEPPWDPWSSLARSSSGRPVLGGGRGGSPTVSLVAFSREAASERREVGGFLLVGWPLDRLGRGARSAAVPEPSAMVQVEPAFGARRAEAELARASSSDGPFALALTPKLARASVRAAWRAAGLGPDDARLDGIVSRARWSSLLPEARFRAIRSDDARLSLDTNADTSRIRDSAGANVGLEARLTWRLHRLVYSDDERVFERIRLDLRDARARIGARVLDALFHWQRATLDVQTLAGSQRGTRDEADAVLRVLEAEAALDVLTNGWFSSRHGHTRAAVSGRPRPALPRPEEESELPSGADDL